MKKYLILVLLLFCVANLFAQLAPPTDINAEVDSQVSRLKQRVNVLEHNNASLQQETSAQKSKIDSISSELLTAQSNIKRVSDSLTSAISGASSSNRLTQSQLNLINETITKRTIYTLLGIFAIVLLSGGIFLFLRNKLAHSTETLGSEIDKTKETLHNEAQKVDSKLVEIEKTNVDLKYEAIKLDSKLGKIEKTNETLQNETVKLDSKLGEMKSQLEKKDAAENKKAKGAPAAETSNNEIIGPANNVEEQPVAEQAPAVVDNEEKIVNTSGSSKKVKE